MVVIYHIHVASDDNDDGHIDDDDVALEYWMRPWGGSIHLQTSTHNYLPGCESSRKYKCIQIENKHTCHCIIIYQYMRAQDNTIETSRG